MKGGGGRSAGLTMATLAIVHELVVLPVLGQLNSLAIIARRHRAPANSGVVVLEVPAGVAVNKERHGELVDEVRSWILVCSFISVALGKVT